MAELTKELQEKFVLYQLLNQRLEQIKQHGAIVQQKMVEFEVTHQALADLKNTKRESEILIPLGSGIYSYAKSGSEEKFIVDLGAGIMAKTTASDADKILEKRKKEIEDAVQALQMEANAIAEKLNEIGPELQKAVQEKGEPSGAG